MSQVSNATVIQLFKRVYGSLNDLIPKGLPISELITFSEKERVGDRYVEAVALTAETGITFGGSSGDIFDINPAIAGAVRQAEVVPYSTVLASVIPWGVISRSVGAGTEGNDKAFASATKHVVKNNVKSHARLNEIAMMYGQHTNHLGRVSYAPSGTVYRGATYSGNGTVTLPNTVYGSIAFTAGINTTNKLILLQPGDFASGIFVGNEGIVIKQLNSSNAVVASGKLVSYDSAMGIIQVDFTPVAASSIGSHTIAFNGFENSAEMIGIKKILTTSGSLFGINTTSYALWRGSQFTLSAKKLTIKVILDALADGINKAGIEGPIIALCNPRSFASMLKDAADLRKYDYSYDAKVEEGGTSIRVHYQEGEVMVRPSRFCMEGEAYLLTAEDWIRSGSAQISFTIPGMPQEIIFPLEQQAGYMFRSYGDQYIFCKAPARSILITGINDESST